MTPEQRREAEIEIIMSAFEGGLIAIQRKLAEHIFDAQLAAKDSSDDPDERALGQAMRHGLQQVERAGSRRDRDGAAVVTLPSEGEAT